MTGAACVIDKELMADLTEGDLSTNAESGSADKRPTMHLGLNSKLLASVKLP